MRMASRRWPVAVGGAFVTGALALGGCGGSAHVSAEGDAALDGSAGSGAMSGSGSSGSGSSGGSSSGAGSGSSGGAGTDGSSDGPTPEAAAGRDATSTADALARDAAEVDSSSGPDVSTGADASADASTQGASDASEAGGTNEDSDAPPGNDASTFDSTVTPDASDASASAEDSGEPSSDAAAGACGTTGLACCPGDQCTDTELWCVGGVCSICGSSGQPCCGVDCNSGNVCIANSERSDCMACGGPGQVCCTSLPECQNEASGYGCYSWGLLENCLNVPAAISTGVTGEPGEKCSSTCSDPADTCFLSMTLMSMNTVGPDPFCVTCGNLDLPCCNGTTCEMGLSCGASGYCE
jgi:hypothetical protein